MESTSIGLSDLMAAFVDNAKLPATVSLLEKNLRENKIIEADVHLGNKDSNDSFKYRVRKKEQILSESILNESFGLAIEGLTSLHMSHSKRTSLIFWLCLLLISSIIVLMVICEIKGSSTLLYFGIFLGCIVGILVLFYHWENNKLHLVESDIREVQKMKVQLELLALINDPIMRQSGYQSVFSSLQRNSTTIINNYSSVGKQVNVNEQHGNVK